MYNFYFYSLVLEVPRVGYQKWNDSLADFLKAMVDASEVRF